MGMSLEDKIEKMKSRQKTISEYKEVIVEFLNKENPLQFTIGGLLEGIHGSNARTSHALTELISEGKVILVEVDKVKYYGLPK